MTKQQLTLGQMMAASRKKTTKPCVVCGAPMVDVLAHRKTCSMNCRYKLHAAKKAGEQK